MLGIGIAALTVPVMALSQTSTAVFAAILAWLQGTLYSLLTQGVMIGIANVLAQITADTYATTAAMQQQLAGQLHGVAQQTAMVTDHRNQMEFGQIATIQGEDGVDIYVNAVPPSGCRRRTQAEILERSFAARVDRRYEWNSEADRHNTNEGRRNLEGGRQVQTFVEAATDGRTSMQWLNNDNLAPEDVEKAREAIKLVTNPQPLPAWAGEGAGPASQEYQMQRELTNEQLGVIQGAFVQQLDLKAPLTDQSNTPIGDSVLTVINEWSQQTVAQKLYPDKIQAKSSPGVMREQALLQAAQLYVASESLKAQSFNNALLAIIALQSLNDTQRTAAEDALRRGIGSSDAQR
jgi:hypothetical protein